MRTLLIVFLSIVNISLALAQDRIFTYTYQSNVLAPGERELEPWTTVRWGRKDFFRAIDTRVEMEMGIANRLQTAFYLNVSQETGEEAGLLNTHEEVSFSNEWKYKVWDPVADPIGFGLYGEWSAGTRELELEAKLIFDKQINKSVWAVNLVAEHEWEKESEGGKTVTEREWVLAGLFGYSYRIAGGTHLGFEVRNHNAIEHGEWERSTLFAGPTFSFFRDGFWINLTVLPQVTAFKGKTSGSRELDHHEKLETRLMFSFIL